MPGGTESAREADRQFRAELALGFGVFEVLVLALTAATELASGTRALGIGYLLALAPALAVVAWLQRGGDPRRGVLLLVSLMFATVTATNLATGGHSIGANIALPTITLIAVMTSPPRAALLWLLAVVAEIVVVAMLRRSGIEFPLRPAGDWVESAIDRVPLFFSLGSALIGWVTARAIERHRSRLSQARDAEHEARLVAAGNARRFADFAEVAADGFWETDAQLRLTHVSPSFAESIGLAPGQMLGLTPEQAYRLRFPEAQGLEAYMTPLLERRPFRDQVLRSLGSDGSPRLLLNQGKPIFDEDGGFAGYRGVVRDVTRQQQAEAALRASEARLRLIADNLPVAITHINEERRFTFNNETHARWLGYGVAELRGKHIEETHQPEVYRQILPHIELAFAGERTSFEVSGGGHDFRATYVPELDAAGRVVGVYGLVLDVSKVKQIERELQNQARIDALTSLPNRRHYEERLAEAIARSERSGVPVGLAFMDLDQFKPINDRLGHRAGDLVLHEFARRIGECTRATDLAARLAGDEFVIVLEPLPSAEVAEAVAAKILRAMREPMAIEGESLPVSCSIGIAIRRPGETDGSTLQRRADALLYEAKAAGGACVRVGV